MIILSKAGWQERVISVRLYSLLNYIAFQGTYTPPYWTFQEKRACPFLSISLLRGWDAAMESWWLEVTNLKVAQIGSILDVTWKGGQRHDDPSYRFIGQVGVPRYSNHTTHKYVGRSTREHPKRGCSIDSD
jgi:hypothetical protein